MAIGLTDLEKEKQLSYQNLMAEHLLLIPLFPFYLFVAYSFFSFYYLNQTDRGPVVKIQCLKKPVKCFVLFDCLRNISRTRKDKSI